MAVFQQYLYRSDVIFVTLVDGLDNFFEFELNQFFFMTFV